MHRQILWRRLVCGLMVLGLGTMDVGRAHAVAPPRSSSRIAGQHGRLGTWGRHGRHSARGTYPDYAWGPAWGSFSLFVAPGRSTFSFGVPEIVYPWTRYIYPGISYAAYGSHGIYYNPATGQNEYGLPPSYTPATTAYGPGALQRFMGLPGSVLVPNGSVASGVTPPIPAATDPATIRDRIRKSNKVTRDRALRFVEFGDALFQKQRYHEAVQRYRSAIEVAPDVADAYYHQGYALLATGRYDLAAKAFRIALQLDAGVPGRLRLQELYEHNLIALDSHFENLVLKTLNEPSNADLLMLVGLFLRDKGEVARATRFLRKARQLAGPPADFLQPLIDGESAEPPAEEVLAGVDT